jgi:hypothetical protein
MTVQELITALQKMPQDAKVYKETGDYQDDWREVKSAAVGQIWEISGVFIE